MELPSTTTSDWHEAQGRTLDIVITHAETSRIFDYVQAHDREGLAEYLKSHIHRMNAAGAVIAAIPAVTPHFCVRELTRSRPCLSCQSSTPWSGSLRYDALGA